MKVIRMTYHGVNGREFEVLLVVEIGQEKVTDERGENEELLPGDISTILVTNPGAYNISIDHRQPPISPSEQRQPHKRRSTEFVFDKVLPSDERRDQEYRQDQQRQNIYPHLFFSHHLPLSSAPHSQGVLHPSLLPGAAVNTYKNMIIPPVISPAPKKSILLSALGSGRRLGTRNKATRGRMIEVPKRM